MTSKKQPHQPRSRKSSSKSVTTLPASKALGPGEVVQKKRGKGRPTTYTIVFAKKICAAYASCKDGIEVVCQNNPGFPNAATIYDWRNQFPDFDKMYARAREQKAEYVASLAVNVAFDEDGDAVPFYGQVHVQRDKLRFEALKWHAAKLDPRKFGDKVDVTTGGDKLPPSIPVDLSNLSYEQLKALTGTEQANQD